MTADLTFRLIGADELPELLRLYRDLNPNDAQLPAARAEAIFARILQSTDSEIWVVDRSGDLVATCVLVTVHNLTRGGRPYALIENVVTRSDRRKQGLGSALLSHVIDVAGSRDCYKVMLQTGSSRPSTHAFYRKAGFRDDVKTAYVIRDDVPKVNY